MTTRFYLPSATTATVAAVTPDAAWDTTTGYTQHLTGTVKGGSAVAAGTARTKDTTTAHRRLDRQYVSDPIVGATITGTFSAVIKTVESNALANAWLDLIIRVVSGNGAVVRGTLYAGSANTVVSATSTVENYEVPTTVATRVKSAIALSSVTAVTGDRVVIEIGYRASATSSAYTVTNTYGDVAATADYALTVALTTALDPWVELSQTLTFDTTPVGRVVMADSFTGTDGDPFDAGRWVTPRSDDAGAFATIQSNRGRMCGGTAGWAAGNARKRAVGVSIQDVEVSGIYRTSPVAASAAFVQIRTDTTMAETNWYGLQIDPGGGAVALIKAVANVYASGLPQQSIAITVSTDYRFRFRAWGSEIRLKFWVASGAEPDTWPVYLIDSALLVAGSVGIDAKSGDNTSEWHEVDDIVIRDLSLPAVVIPPIQNMQAVHRATEW